MRSSVFELLHSRHSSSCDTAQPAGWGVYARPARSGLWEHRAHLLAPPPSHPTPPGGFQVAEHRSRKTPVSPVGPDAPAAARHWAPSSRIHSMGTAQGEKGQDGRGGSKSRTTRTVRGHCSLTRWGGGVTEFSGKGPRRWLDSADSCLVHTNPPRPPNHSDAHFRPHSKCCPQGQPDPRAAGRLQVAWVSDWWTPSRAGDRVQVALRRLGARERQAPARRGSHPAALRRARRLTRAAHHVRPWRARNAGGPARLPEPRGWWPGRPVPRARGQC